MKHRKQRGTQIVEFAIVLPLLAFLVLVVAEAANMFRVHGLITNAAREGARLAVVPQNAFTALGISNPSSCTFSTGSTTTLNPICNGVAAYLHDNNVVGDIFVQCSTITINVDQANISLGVEYSKVQVSCPYQLQYLPRWPSFSVASVFNLGSTSTFRNLY